MGSPDASVRILLGTRDKVSGLELGCTESSLAHLVWPTRRDSCLDVISVAGKFQLWLRSRKVSGLGEKEHGWRGPGSKPDLGGIIYWCRTIVSCKAMGPSCGLSHSAGCWDPPSCQQGMLEQLSCAWAPFPLLDNVQKALIRLGRCLRRVQFAPDSGRPCVVSPGSSSWEERGPPGLWALGSRELGGQKRSQQLSGVLSELGASSCKVWGHFSSRSLHLAETLRLPSLLVGCTRILPQNQTE